MHYARHTLLSMAVIAAAVPMTLHASAFGLIQQSAVTGGTAYAGTAVTPADPATVYHNPAGMVRQQGRAFAVVGHYNAPSYVFSGTAYDESGNFIGGRQRSLDGADSAFVPNFYYMHRFHEDWAAGLSINVPFGSTTEYPKDWVGRYHGVESAIMALNINPNIAYRVNDRFSIGGGISAQYFDVTLSQQIRPPLVDTGIIGSVQPEGDIFGEIEGDSWAFSFNLGVLWDVTDALQLGLAYRHSTRHKVEGNMVAQGTPTASVPILGDITVPVDIDESGYARIELPESVTLSAGWRPQAQPRLRVLGDLAYTRWSRVGQIDVRTDSPVMIQVPDDVPVVGGEQIEQRPPSLDLRLKNSWRAAIGMTWEQTQRLQLRAGFSFQESSVRDALSRTPRIPDTHRRWYSIGAGYELAPGLVIDGAYARVETSKASIRNTYVMDEDAGTSATLDGEYDNSADIFSLQLTYRF